MCRTQARAMCWANNGLNTGNYRRVFKSGWAANSALNATKVAAVKINKAAKLQISKQKSDVWTLQRSVGVAYSGIRAFLHALHTRRAHFARSVFSSIRSHSKRKRRHAENSHAAATALSAFLCMTVPVNLTLTSNNSIRPITHRLIGQNWKRASRTKTAANRSIVSKQPHKWLNENETCTCASVMLCNQHEPLVLSHTKLHDTRCPTQQRRLSFFSE